jgi:hypothetical protein
MEGPKPLLAVVYAIDYNLGLGDLVVEPVDLLFAVVAHFIHHLSVSDTASGSIAHPEAQRAVRTLAVRSG